jgi:hypothetical protein
MLFASSLSTVSKAQFEKEQEMSNVKIQNQIAAAFAALFSAALLVAASVGPAVQNSASLIA